MEMTEDLHQKLEISQENLLEVNSYLTDPSNRLVKELFDVIEKYGGIDEINQRAEENGRIENLLLRLKKENKEYLKDIEWLINQKEKGKFIKMEDYKKDVLKDKYSSTSFDDSFAITLEISALQFFPWLITQAKGAIERRELMPDRFIRVRNMKESEKDCGDLLAMVSAMKILQGSYVETLDTKGTDGSNIHLNGPATIMGYLGGVGQPNNHPLEWVDEFLYYYTNYGIKQVLNINSGTVLVGYMLHKLGINNEFKISVFLGNDNPYSVLETLMVAKLFSRDDGRTPLVGFNLSNSVNNKTIELSAEIRKNLGFEDYVRFEHHIIEAWKSIVKQPYDRTKELVELGKKVKNISAKHEGGPVEIEQDIPHPSDILDYFISKEEILSKNLMEDLELNYLDKHESMNRTARALIQAGIPVIAARGLHY